MSGRRRQRNTSFTMRAVLRRGRVAVKPYSQTLVPRVGLEEAPDARGGRARPAVGLRALAVDDVRGAPGVARAALALDRRSAAVGPGPPVARAMHHLGGHDAVGAAVDDEHGHGP